MIAAVVALLTAVVATYLLAGSFGGRGAGPPGQAVDGFLAAIYDARDPRAAGTFVCDGPAMTLSSTLVLIEDGGWWVCDLRAVA